MATYFFDVHDGDAFTVDPVGIDLEDLGEARDQAAALLPDMARGRLIDGEHRVFLAQVRDHGGRVVYRATLTFRGVWLADSFRPDAPLSVPSGDEDLAGRSRADHRSARQLARRKRRHQISLLTRAEGTRDEVRHDGRVAMPESEGPSGDDSHGDQGSD